MKLAVVGSGALGLTFAAGLARAHDVVVLARRAEVADAIARDGITVDSDGAQTEHVPVTVTLDPHALVDRDAVVVAVKAYQTRDALARLRGVLAANTLVASVQNGLDNDRIAREVLPQSRVVAGSTTQGAIVLGPGRVHANRGGTTIFARDERAYPGSDELAAAFTESGFAARVVDDIAPVLWTKLVINAAINPVGALARRANGAIATDPDLGPLARALAHEAAAVAAAEGVRIEDPWSLVEAAAHATAANRNSMLQDLDAGRTTEIDAIGGAIVRHATAHGIPVPLTDALVKLIRARERQEAGR